MAIGYSTTKGREVERNGKTDQGNGQELRERSAAQ